jgi:glycosyltransferase involved in cell wall biosynthesis
MYKKLKITVLTPSYNQGKFIEQTIKSILNQDYDNVEHIIIDGGSTDNTVEVLKKYPHLIWISEKDEGQSDALNKGLAMATGDIIGWLNSDDFYEENIFADVINHFQEPTVEWIIGNTVDYFEELNYKRMVKSPTITYENILKNPDITRQPGTFHRKSILDKVNGWNKKLKFCMDFDLWVKLTKIATPKMVDKTYTYFRIHAEQKTTAKNKLEYIKVNSSILRKEKISFLKRKRVFYKNYKSIFKYFVKSVLIKLHLMNKKYKNIPYSMRKIT